MIIKGATGHAAELAFHLPSAADATPVTGHAFVTGEVEVRWPGGAFGDAVVAHVVEKGFGDYALQGQGADTAIAGCAYLYTTITGAQPWRGFEFVADAADPALLEVPFVLTLDADRIFGDTTGRSFALGDVKLQFSAGGYVDVPISQIVERGHNMYAVVLTPTQRLNTGSVYIYVPATADTIQFSAVYDMVLAAASGALTAPTISNLVPVAGATAGEPGAFALDYTTARHTPVEFDLTGIPAGAGITISAKFANRSERYVALDHDGTWQWPFDVLSSIGDLTAEPVHVSLMPRDGWPPVHVDIKVAAVKSAVTV